MIEQLFGNISRRKLVEFFLTHSYESFSFEELKENLKNDITPQAIKNDMTVLSGIGLLEGYWQNIILPQTIETDQKKPKKSKTKVKNIKPLKEIRFQINPTFPLLPELRSLILKSIIYWEQKLVKKIKSLGPVNYLAFTGFFTDSPLSSTDILIVGRVNKKRLSNLMKSFQKDLHRPVRYTFLLKSEFQYRIDITDRFLYDILESKKIVVIDDLIKK